MDYTTKIRILIGCGIFVLILTISLIVMALYGVFNGETKTETSDGDNAGVDDGVDGGDDGVEKTKENWNTITQNKYVYGCEAQTYTKVSDGVWEGSLEGHEKRYLTLNKTDDIPYYNKLYCADTPVIQKKEGQTFDDIGGWYNYKAMDDDVFEYSNN